MKRNNKQIIALLAITALNVACGDMVYDKSKPSKATPMVIRGAEPDAVANVLNKGIEAEGRISLNKYHQNPHHTDWDVKILFYDKAIDESALLATKPIKGIAAVSLGDKPLEIEILMEGATAARERSAILSWPVSSRPSASFQDVNTWNKSGHDAIADREIGGPSGLNLPRR